MPVLGAMLVLVLVVMLLFVIFVVSCLAGRPVGHLQ
jgi:hypothetical protein